MDIKPNTELTCQLPSALPELNDQLKSRMACPTLRPDKMLRPGTGTGTARGGVDTSEDEESQPPGARVVAVGRCRLTLSNPS